MRFKDQAVIVTGGGRAIGREICHRFAREGARVLVADIDGVNARAVADEIREREGHAEPFTFDMTVPAQVEAMVARCEELCGSVDVLVNNASIGHAQYVLDITPEEWEHVIKTDLTGPFFCAQAAARRMVRSGKGGKIVNLASISGERGGTGRAAYGAAKAGIELLTKVMAAELAAKGIHVNAVSPGPVDTPQSRATHNPETREAYIRMIPAGRYGEPTEIASAVLFLASKEASWIHGAILHADGGFSAAGLMVSLG